MVHAESILFKKENSEKNNSCFLFQVLGTLVPKINLYIRYINYPVSSRLCILWKILNVQNFPVGGLSFEEELLNLSSNKEAQVAQKTNAAHILKSFSHYKFFIAKETEGYFTLVKFSLVFVVCGETRN
jgi:hypothetical protein